MFCSSLIFIKSKDKSLVHIKDNLSVKGVIDYIGINSRNYVNTTLNINLHKNDELDFLKESIEDIEKIYEDTIKEINKPKGKPNLSFEVKDMDELINKNSQSDNKNEGEKQGEKEEI